MGVVELVVCHCVCGLYQSLYIEGGRFMDVKSDLKIVEEITK